VVKHCLSYNAQVWPETLKHAHAVDHHRSMIEALEFLWKGEGLKVLEDDGKTYRKLRPFKEPDDDDEEEDGDDDEYDSDGDEDEDDGEVETWMQRLERESFGWKPPPDFTLRTSMDLMAVIEAIAAPNQPKAGSSAASRGGAPAKTTKKGTGASPKGAAGASPSSRSAPMARLAPYDLVTCAYVLGDLTAQMSGPALKSSAAASTATASTSKRSSSNDDITEAFKTDVARADAVNAARAERQQVHAASTAAQQSVAAAAAVALWGCVAPGGLLVLVEPGDKAGAMRLQAARQALLKAYAPPPSSRTSGALSGAAHQAKRASKAPTATIVAPCTHHLTCPFDPKAPKSALESLAISAGVGKSNSSSSRRTGGRRSGTRQGRPGDNRSRSNSSGHEDSSSGGAGTSASSGGWCRFVQRVPRERLKGGPNADERFSYLVVHKSDPRNSSRSNSGSSNMNSSSDGSSVVSHDSNDNEDNQEVNPAEEAVESGGRLLRTPLKRTGHVVLDVCRPATKGGMGTPGAKAVLSAARRNSAKTGTLLGTGGQATGAARPNDSVVQASLEEEEEEEEEFAAVERRIVSRAKHPALFAAARKATWGGTWPADEALLWRSEKPASEESAEAMFTKYFGPKGLSLPPDEVKKRVAVALQFQQEQMEEAEALAANQVEAAGEYEVEVEERVREGGGDEGGGESATNKRGRGRPKRSSGGDDDHDSGLSEINAFLNRIQKAQPNALDGFQGDKELDSTLSADYAPQEDARSDKENEELSYTVDLLNLNKRKNSPTKEPKKSQPGSDKKEGGRKRRPRFMSNRIEK